jgi:CheY-like chemotaxis protein
MDGPILPSVGSGRRILVVSDDALLAPSVCVFLTDEGYDVRRAAEGQEGLVILADWTADLVLLDLYMPGLDGWGFLAALASAPVRARPLVVIWSVAGADELEHAQQLGADACLPRGSAGPEELLRALDRLLLGHC